MTSITPFPLDYVTYDKVKQDVYTKHIKEEDFEKYFDWLEENEEKLEFNFIK